MKKIYISLVMLFMTFSLAFSQNNPAVTFSNSKGDNLTLELVEIIDSTTGQHLWTADKISSEDSKILFLVNGLVIKVGEMDSITTFQNQTIITQSTQIETLNSKVIELNAKLDSLGLYVSTLDTVVVIPPDTIVTPPDTVVVIPPDTIVIPPVVCNDPLDQLQFILMDAKTDDTIRPLEAEDMINIALGEYTIIVTSCETSAIKRVNFILDGIQIKSEGIEPFTINGDAAGDFKAWLPAVGTHVLSATVERKDGQPTESIQITLKVINEVVSIPENPSEWGTDRIALVHDGNAADADDHGALALSIGMIKWAGALDNLVYVGHSSLYRSDCSTTFLKGNELPYNFNDWCEIIDTCAKGSLIRAGGNTSIVYSFRSDWLDNNQLNESINALTEAMESSTPDSHLWVSCAGPMDVVYRALAAVTPDKLQYIHMVSHSNWNETSVFGGLTYTWVDMVSQYPQANFHKIQDQNISNGTFDFREENNPSVAWNWMYYINSGDNLADFIRKTNNEGFLANKNNSIRLDWSDAGMVYWILSGADNGGCETCGTKEVEQLFKTGTF